MPTLADLPADILADLVCTYIHDPRQVFALSLVNKRTNAALDSCWAYLGRAYARFWGDHTIATPTDLSARRSSKRLKETYSSRSLFCRTVKCAAQNAMQVHGWLFECGKHKLTSSRMRAWLTTSIPVWVDFGGVTGGSILLETLRSKALAPRHSLSTTKLLCEEWDADVNLAAEGVTPLAVAAARGMSAVVAYLLMKGAKPQAVSAGQFSLEGNRRKSVKGLFTPLQWSENMLAAERALGTPERLLTELHHCIRILR
jgi:hypothetical protein